MEWSHILPLLIGGLVLFLYAINQLSDILGELFTDKAKRIIRRFTSNLFTSILVGTALTILLDSSSAVIILTIVFINAGSLDFRQAVGIIMGANIGTTFGSQIIAMDVGKYAIYPMLIGLAMNIFLRNRTVKQYGSIMLYFGMLFFGLYIMEESVLPLRDSQQFVDWIARIENNHVEGAISGGIITLIVQSSSATVGMAIVLGKQNLINLSGGIAVMLGAELGTCSDTLLATINSTRQALKAGLFHLLFNFTTICIGLLIFDPFVIIVEYLSGHQGIDRQIANAHMLFNFLGVLFFIPFVGLSVKFFEWILPEKN
jgi:phosphate:Na+ symporter